MKKIIFAIILILNVYCALPKDTLDIQIRCVSPSNLVVGLQDRVSKVRSYGDACDFLITNTITNNILTSGSNGLDFGSIESNRMYALYLVANKNLVDRNYRSKVYNAVGIATLVSTNFVRPTYPTNANGEDVFDAYRYLGCFYVTTNTNGAVFGAIGFLNIGTNNTRVTMWESLNDVFNITANAGTNDSFTTIDIFSYSSPYTTHAIIGVHVNTNYAYISGDNSSSIPFKVFTNNIAIGSPGYLDEYDLPCVTRAIRYKSYDTNVTTTIYLLGIREKTP